MALGSNPNHYCFFQSNALSHQWNLISDIVTAWLEIWKNKIGWREEKGQAICLQNSTVTFAILLSKLQLNKNVLIVLMFSTEGLCHIALNMKEIKDFVSHKKIITFAQSVCRSVKNNHLVNITQSWTGARCAKHWQSLLLRQ